MTSLHSGNAEIPPTAGAWPFLVAAGIRLGIRVVIAPEFLCAVGDTDAVFDAARTGPGIPSIGTVQRVVQSASGESLTLVFRTVSATAEELDVRVTGGRPGQTGRTALRDTSGRAIMLIEGFVLRGRYRHVSLTEDEWRHLHEIVLGGYRRFLDHEAQGPTLTPSQEFGLSAPGVLEEQIPEPVGAANNPRPRRRRAIAIASLTALAALIVLVIALTSGGTPAKPPAVSCSAPPAQPGCPSPTTKITSLCPVASTKSGSGNAAVAVTTAVPGSPSSSAHAASSTQAPCATSTPTS